MPIVATAGWSIPKTVADYFPRGGSGLTRYASVFRGVEINSTFYDRHLPTTFARWAASVPNDFRFSVKIPREITHRRSLKNIADPFDTFLQDISPLGEKLGPLLCQLPPAHVFDKDETESALTVMRSFFTGTLVIEVRHNSWRSDEAICLLEKHRIDRVLADPPVVWSASDFATRARYVRLHGKPKMYYSKYSIEEMVLFSELLGSDSWCVFDNTASGAAMPNALELRKMLNKVD